VRIGDPNWRVGLDVSSREERGRSETLRERSGKRKASFRLLFKGSREPNREGEKGQGKDDTMTPGWVK